MPPAFNLSQDQTLQFNHCYCFLFFRIGRSLNVLTSSSHLSVSQKTLKTYLNTSVRLDTFAFPYPVRRQNTASAHQAPTLIGCWFLKNIRLKPHRPKPPRRCLFLASLRSQQRNEIM